MLLMLCSFLLSLVSLIPKLETVFEMVPFEDLPLHTRIMVTASRIFRVHPGAYTVAIFGSMFGFVLWARTYEGRAFLFRIIQLLPFVRSVIDQQVRARFLRDLARLQRETGRGMIELACAAIPFPPLAERLGRVGDRLDQGTPLSVALDESGFFSANTLSYIEGGESSGRLEEMLVAAAEEETDNANERVDLLAAAIEPASIVVVGVFVSLLLTSVYGGIFAMQKVMRDRARTSDLPSFYTHPCSSDNATCPAIRYVTSALPGRTTT
jgi:general secretion pathway protein F